MSERLGRRGKKWGRLAKAVCCSVPMLSATWGAWQPALAGETTRDAVRLVSHCTTDANCQCPGCTAFRDQQRHGITPPIVSEVAPFHPPVDCESMPQVAPDITEQSPTSPTEPATDHPSTDTTREPFSPTTDPSATAGSDANADTSPSPLSDATSPSPSTSGQLASAFGGSAGGLGAPSMIGDFFGGGLILAGDSLGDVPISLPIAGGDRRHKMAENGSPLPQDRVLFNYNHFHNAVRDIRGNDVDVNRYLFGVERTFLDGMASVELRVPFASGVNATQRIGDQDVTGNEFGNISTTLKGLLWRDACNAFAVGMTTIWPTADDGALIGTPGFGTVQIDNGSVHFAPFIGYLRTPNNRSFHQFFTQLDFDSGGYDVVFNDQRAGTIQEQTLMYLSYSYGRWVYRNPCAILSGIAPMLELHYTTTLQDVDQGPLAFTVLDNRRDILNLMGGLHMQLGNDSVVRVSSGAPLRTGTNREFDAEISVQFMRYF